MPRADRAAADRRHRHGAQHVGGVEDAEVLAVAFDEEVVALEADRHQVVGGVVDLPGHHRS
jgi:hypothetical protein